MEFTEKQLQRSRILYIIEATVEYLLSLLVAGSYLATLTSAIGLSDGLTGILSSIVSLGCLFKLLALTLRRRTVKRIVTVLSVANQLLFTFLYVVPLVPISTTAKSVIFFIFIFAAYIIYNFIEPHKINWLMSLVEDKKRGTFTANKEIVSLISGMIFTFAMGTVMDHFLLAGNSNVAFIIAAIVMLVLMTAHTLTLVFAVEKELPEEKKTSLKESVGAVIKDKNVLKVTVVYVLYYLSNYAAVPFYGTYMIRELGFTLQLVSVFTMCASFIRVFVSRAWGRYADKNSFAALAEKCFFVLGLSYICVVFATPKTGIVMFVLYNLLHGIAFGGVNSALTNLVFDYAPVERRASALAVSRAVAGLVGFLTTLAISPFVTFVQNTGNSIFGITVYAQQIISLFAALAIFGGALYARKALVKK